MKGYKAFHKGMICNGKQYVENTVYEEQGCNICGPGVMHYCETPFDTWDYYPVVDENGDFTEYTEVEPLDEVLARDNKRATKKLRIGAKLSFKDFIKAAISVVIETTKLQKIENSDMTDNESNWAKIGSSGDRAQIGSSGNWAQIGSSGYGAKIGSSGKGAQIGSSGYGARINMRGTDSVGAAIGYNSVAKGVTGNWIVLAEWKERDDGSLYPSCVRAGMIDGETIKADTWYKLQDGEFTEVGE